MKDQGQKEYLFYLSDLATAEQQKRYNLFHLTEGSDVTFSNDGDYHYFIYQMPDGGSEDYSLGQLCEQGKATIKAEETTIPAFKPSTNFTVHE